ncbi:MAG: FHA domain-containing protein [Alphaproteobacteria bacterium]|nr:FHA domain-containing protein [Alphaproteobacteria bacterium]MCB9695730.1 FHA domain-containing protein [Alphaproteobacteria bacterium]
MWAVCIIADGIVVAEKSVATAVFRMGRDPAGDLVLDDPLASWSHATLVVEGDKLLVRDERSSNGTYVDEERVVSPVELEGDETLRVGGTLLRVRKGAGGAATRWLLVEPATGVRLPLDTEIFRVGGGEEDDLRVPDADAGALVLTIRGGEVWREGEAVPLQRGVELVVGSARFRLDVADGQRVPTAIDAAQQTPYTVSARRNGPHGPEATVESTTGERYHVQTGNRAILLYLLARKVADDGELPAKDRGWIDEHDVQRGIWGRDGDQNKLDVLLYRLRRELQRAGIDPWFVEKRNRQLRVRVLTSNVTE